MERVNRMVIGIAPSRLSLGYLASASVKAAASDWRWGAITPRSIAMRSACAESSQKQPNRRRRPVLKQHNNSLAARHVRLMRRVRRERVKVKMGVGVGVGVSAWAGDRQVDAILGVRRRRERGRGVGW